MKVIDLLNKIANGEEIPKKIKVNGIIFEYQGDDYLFTDKDNTDYWLFSDCYCDKFEYLESFLKTGVEIIEDKKIRKLPNEVQEPKNFEEVVYIAEDLARKINEIIDKLIAGDDKK